MARLEIGIEDKEMSKPVLCGGEILVDFLSKDIGKGLAESILFEKRPGGSIFNVAVGLNRLGVPSHLLTKMGGDEFSKGLLDVIVKEKIGSNLIIRDPKLKTTLAFAAINKEGKPEFRFYREKAADTALTVAEIKSINPDEYSLYHFGSISLLKKPSSDAYLELLNIFHKSKVTTSFDPNIRPSLIRNRKKYLEMFLKITEVVDILKLSNDDLEYITGLKDSKEGLKKVPHKANCLIFVTLGGDGAMCFYKDHFVYSPAFKVPIKETTGCGDAFMAAIIFKLLHDNNLDSLSEHQLKEFLTFANAAAAIVGTRYGASNAMPRLSEVNKFRTSKLVR